MARGVNKVILVGNLGNDPETRYTESGTAISNITVATSESWKDKQTGQQQERTEWHRIAFFGKLAEIVAQYLRKGSKVYIEGALRTRKWQDQQGQDRYTTEIVASEMQMLDSKNESQQGQPRQSGLDNAFNGQRQPQMRQPAQNQPPQPVPSNQGFGDFYDDIPF